jgi:hypothetical protein
MRAHRRGRSTLQTVCGVKAVNSSCNLSKADSAPLPAPVRGHARLQHRPPKFASSITWLGESAAIGHSPRGVFFDGTVLFPAELPAIDCRPTADMASRPRSSARLPCADGAPPYAAASILINDCGASLLSTEIITRGLIDPILTRRGASERLPRAENRCAVRLHHRFDNRAGLWNRFKAYGT